MPNQATRNASGSNHVRCSPGLGCFHEFFLREIRGEMPWLSLFVMVKHTLKKACHA
jgi:hypothetical protein